MYYKEREKEQPKIWEKTTRGQCDGWHGERDKEQRHGHQSLK